MSSWIIYMERFHQIKRCARFSVVIVLDAQDILTLKYIEIEIFMAVIAGISFSLFLILFVMKNGTFYSI